MRAPRAIRGAVATAVVAVALAGAHSSGVGPAGAQGPPPPNVLVVMTDDQTAKSLQAMGNVRSLIGEPGTTFTNSIVSFPLCCPSRATFLTGQYSRNHGVRVGNDYAALDGSNTLPVWLQNAGYVTAHVGKYVNGYGFTDQTEVPPGWSEWYATTARTDQEVNGYFVNENGVRVHYGAGAENFKGDVLTRLARNFIYRRTSSSAPFFLSVGYTAPHAVPREMGPLGECLGLAQPAPRHIGGVAGVQFAPRPSFNEANVSDKHKEVRDGSLLSPAAIDRIEQSYRCRLASLRHVDEGVAQLLGALDAIGELGSTLVIFTSDNGFFHGEHRIVTGKLQSYEEAIRVPLVMRGPGVPAGERLDALAANIDLAPTILDAAGAAPGRRQDGKSLFDVIARPGRQRAILIENREPHATLYAGVRTARYSYTDYAVGGRELYDLKRDPAQRKSVDDSRRYRPVVDWMEGRLNALRRCEDGDCRKPAHVPSPR